MIRRWAKMEVDEANCPAPRWRHTANKLTDAKMLIWGGIGEKNRYNDIHLLNMEEETAFWSETKPEVTSRYTTLALYVQIWQARASVSRL